ncbi:3-dehydroquinate synthase [bacterium]|nr:3-dehydroquinate synthase [bacterium]
MEYFYNIVDSFLKSNPFFIIDDYFPLIKSDRVYYLYADENRKSLSTIEKIITKMQALNIKSGTPLVAIGGGITTDVAGFIANIYRRGLPFYSIPTTLLSMVDASIGGKNGINYGGVKNSLGTIYFPKDIIIETNFLKTLPEIEFISGWIEILKIFLLQNRALWGETSKGLSKKTDIDWLTKVVFSAKKYKESIVEQDPYSKNLRHLLNFGHTLGHAVELQQNLPHGIAVGLGILFASFISMDILNFSEYREIFDVISQLYDYDKVVRKMNTPDIMKKMVQDKKNVDDESIDFVLIQKIGSYPSNIKYSLKTSYIQKMIYEFQKNYNKI